MIRRHAREPSYEGATELGGCLLLLTPIVRANLGSDAGQVKSWDRMNPGAFPARFGGKLRFARLISAMDAFLTPKPLLGC